MRTIKFRGKRVDTGEMIFGCYRRGYKGGHFIQHECFYQDHLVDPATVGQYTGLKDKNGVEIYEGDILICNSCVKQYVAWSDRWNGWKLLNMDNIGGTIDICLSDIVIGNIHEGEA